MIDCCEKLDEGFNYQAAKLMCVVSTHI